MPHHVVQDRPPHAPGARRRARRAFALQELIFLIFIGAGAAALLAVEANRSDRLASLSESLANLKRFGEGTTSYAADNQDRFFAFSWRANRIGPTTFPDLRVQAESSDAQAHAAQAVDILRRRTGQSNIDQVNGWLASAQYTHLVLADYHAESLPAFWMISPEDKNRQLWAADPAGFQNGVYTPAPNPPSPRWSYSSSYERPLCLSTWDYVTSTRGTVTQSGSHSMYQIVNASGGGGNVFGDRRLTETAYPSQKATGWDSAQRHHGTTDQFFLYADARVPVLSADGGARVRATGNANRGFDPASPRISFPMSVLYTPAAWEPAPRTGSTVQFYARYRFTRSGPGGRDFDADEVPVP